MGEAFRVMAFLGREGKKGSQGYMIPRVEGNIWGRNGLALARLPERYHPPSPTDPRPSPFSLCTLVRLRGALAFITS